MPGWDPAWEAVTAGAFLVSLMRPDLKKNRKTF